jgi:tRNA A-37 threonylcarbamoyl transferase component Bud32
MGIVHGDLHRHPNDVIVDSSGEPWLIDFDLSYVSDNAHKGMLEDLEVFENFDLDDRTLLQNLTAQW